MDIFININYYFIKLYSGYNKGKISESKNIYYDLLNNYDIDGFYEEIINNNLNKYKNQIINQFNIQKDKYDLDINLII